MTAVRVVAPVSGAPVSGAVREKTRAPARLRRVTVVWALLFVNVLAFTKMPMLIPVPHRVGQGITQGALVAALVLALTINPRCVVRPNLFLGLYSLLGVLTLMMSIRVLGLGSAYRVGRLLALLVVLWLLTPWWRDRGLVLLRSHLRVLHLILGSLILGAILVPGKAFALNFGSHRLDGAVWPIPATQVGHYMAELTGLTVLLWMCRMVTRRHALVVIGLGVAGLIACHTRTALVGLVAALIVSTLSLFSSKRRVRRTFVTALVVVVALALPLSPLVNSWLTRGQTSQQVGDLSGRTNVWGLVLNEQRPATNKLFGSGLSNGSVQDKADPAVDGLPIDGSWIATYQDQGVVGMVLEGAMFLALLVIALLRPRGPTRAMALFLIVYCLFASFTETGMGEASPYLLDLTLAASLLVPRAAAAELPRPTASN